MRHKNNDPLPTTLQTYPNPAETLVTVNGLDSNMTYSITLLNSLGMTVMPETQLNSNLLGELPISVDMLSSGLYYIQMKSATGTMMAKFVKR